MVGKVGGGDDETGTAQGRAVRDPVPFPSPGADRGTPATTRGRIPGKMRVEGGCLAPGP